MKKSIVLIVLVVLVSTLMTAAVSLPSPTVLVKGTLGWDRASVCNVPDFITMSPSATDPLGRYYLTGNFKPSDGHLRGCHIVASGFLYNTSGCSYFNVKSYSLACPTQ